MVISHVAEGITRRIENTGDQISGLFEPVVCLGVTGLSRAGKTVFITSLVANLLDRGRMPGLSGNIGGRIQAVWLQPHPDNTVPRFDFENHLNTLTGANPDWPAGTYSVSQLRLSFRIQSAGILRRLSGPRTLHLDIVDYPGEWLTDLSLIDQTYAQWSAATLENLHPGPAADRYLARARALFEAAEFVETDARDLAALFTQYLHAARAAGRSHCTPGRFLMPGDLAGAPALSFAPLPRPERPARRGLWRQMERRFEAYKKHIVTPFFRDHFSRVDRQIILTDALGALHRGPAATRDLRDAMARVLKAFKPGGNGVLGWLWRKRRVEKLLFAATKADLLHHSQHGRLTAVMEALLRDARDRAEFSGAQTGVMAIAGLRTTVEAEVKHNGRRLKCVRGQAFESPEARESLAGNSDAVGGGAATGGGETMFYAGDLPQDPRGLLNGDGDDGGGGDGGGGRGEWMAGDFDAMRFRPAAQSLKPGMGPPHIRLDKAAEFLFGDLL